MTAEKIVAKNFSVSDITFLAAPPLLPCVTFFHSFCQHIIFPFPSDVFLNGSLGNSSCDFIY